MHLAKPYMKIFNSNDQGFYISLRLKQLEAWEPGWYNRKIEDKYSLSEKKEKQTQFTLRRLNSSILWYDLITLPNPEFMHKWCQILIRFRPNPVTNHVKFW